MIKRFCIKMILPAFVTGLLLTGCNSETKPAAENCIRLDSLLVDKTYRVPNGEANLQCLLQMRFLYPVDFPNKEILKRIQRRFVSGYFGDGYEDLSPQEAFDKYTDDYIDSFKSQINELQILPDHHQEAIESCFNYETSENRIVYNQNNLISYVVAKEYYTGGAHGAHHITNGVIDLNTGLQINESDLFIEDYQDDLAKVIVDEIGLSNNAGSVSELENMGFFNVNEIYPNRNFYVNETGITYTFNEYEIAAYVVGAVSVPIPYEKIRHLLRKESPIASIAF